MGKSDFELPNMDDLAKQMEEATAEVEKAMEGLGQLGSISDVVGSLSSVTEDLPGQLNDLTGALGDFSLQHEENVESAVGEPDWAMTARIQVGEVLDVAVEASLNVAAVKQAWESTQGVGFEALVGETMADAGVEIEDGEIGQIMEQLSQGRSTAAVEHVDVLAVRMQGAPGDAQQTLQLSPEANIPLSMDERGLKVELAPLLTIKNGWENADIPTFSPMGEEIVVPFENFEADQAFDATYTLESQEEEVAVALRFQPLH